ncbi:sulfite oxidase [Natrinema halophilum]|uniref:sulfite oxidase n=1 Tax=Natrinema halophilum TaxID=1699371 RepID=UPI001F1731E1|nr:sulfite oxidase [Natrinema halophilum]UHQ96365.1 sulfite oxidase [Natrinema halophilum]
MPDNTDTGVENKFQDRIHEQYPELDIVPSDGESVGAGPKDRSTYTTVETPIEEFYVLNHHPVPDIDADEWSISLTGAVDEPTELSMDELREDYPTTTTTHTMVCAGNGRTYFSSVNDEPERYLQWEYNSAGTARWTGTPLSAILEDHGAETDEGSWLAAIGGDAPNDDADVFARSLPMSKVQNDCLLAYEMNDEPLPPDHGFPVRIIVPGWYGVNSVKWVEELRVMDRMLAGEKWEQYTHWQQDFYRMKFDPDREATEHDDLAEFDTWEQFTGDAVASPYLYDQNVMSLIGYPTDNSSVEPGPDGNIEIIGVAWAGDDRVESVHLSADDGDTWHEARFVSPDEGPGVWRLFRCVLDLPAGDHYLVSRATDEHGRSQPSRTSDPGTEKKEVDPDEYPWNREGYGNNAYTSYGVDFTVKR